MPKNLEQIRAANALKAVQQGGFDRNDVNGLPALVLCSGLLATAAFVSVDQQSDTRTGKWRAMDAVAKHLRDSQMGPLLKWPPTKYTNETKGMLDELAEAQSSALRVATAEALAFLSYLKRFAPKT